MPPPRPNPLLAVPLLRPPPEADRPEWAERPNAKRNALEANLLHAKKVRVKSVWRGMQTSGIWRNTPDNDLSQSSGEAEPLWLFRNRPLLGNQMLTS